MEPVRARPARLRLCCAVTTITLVPMHLILVQDPLASARGG
jgi:hypothetical protein